ncbi:PH domain-containing protein [Corynebacterium uterequi]|uniref:YdbS-like PH domain-containing protein n=1 Tax=Corynebacterium uterequi TaxID=1072256 RepID=A0A0G3HH27_9CORY|nr:PH domain-containing protein [Corynebacterium uterequi]AKK10467.1 hypothetical protein CUTER_02260 [Corynebacterium uterequi]
MSSEPLAGMNPVSPRLARIRLIANCSFFGVLAVAAGALAYFHSRWWLIGVAVFVLLICWLLWLIPAQVRMMGWQETDHEFVIVKGKIWHTVTVVPYGRIQFVDVTAGPLERANGLKTIELHTASSTSDSELPGLPADTADELRQRLAEKARERMSGL